MVNMSDNDAAMPDPGKGRGEEPFAPPPGMQPGHFPPFGVGNDPLRELELQGELLGKGVGLLEYSQYATDDDFKDYEAELRLLDEFCLDRDISDFMDDVSVGELMERGDSTRIMRMLMALDERGALKIGTVLVDPSGHRLRGTFNEGKPDQWPDQVEDHDGNEISSRGLEFKGAIKLAHSPS